MLYSLSAGALLLPFSIALSGIAEISLSNGPPVDTGQNLQHVFTFTVDNSYRTCQSQCIPEPGVTCLTYEAEGTSPSGPILFRSLPAYEFSMQGFQASDCTGQAVGVKAADFQ